VRVTVTVAVGALALAGPGYATHSPSAKLAASLEQAVSAAYDGYVFTKVTCTLPSATATSARCKAFFTNKASGLKGVFHIAVTIDRKTGRVRWRATSAAAVRS
jgi:hypothetical protein